MEDIEVEMPLWNNHWKQWIGFNYDPSERFPQPDWFDEAMRRGE